MIRPTNEKFVMKTKALKTVTKPPSYLETALDELEEKFGPLALGVAMRNRLKHRGRRKERSLKTKLHVWSMLEERSRQHKESIDAACRFAAKHWVICDMNEFVGQLSATKEAIERLQYPSSTWRRIHAQTSQYLASTPGERVRQESFLEICLDTTRDIAPCGA